MPDMKPAAIAAAVGMDVVPTAPPGVHGRAHSLAPGRIVFFAFTLFSAYAAFGGHNLPLSSCPYLYEPSLPPGGRGGLLLFPQVPTCGSTSTRCARESSAALGLKSPCKIDLLPKPCSVFGNTFFGFYIVVCKPQFEVIDPSFCPARMVSVVPEIMDHVFVFGEPTRIFIGKTLCLIALCEPYPATVNSDHIIRSGVMMVGSLNGYIFSAITDEKLP